MAEEQKDLKDLLLKDLCGRLPYGVKVQTTYINPQTKERKDIGTDVLSTVEISMLIDGYEEHKPYLFPLTSMTEEHIFEINNILGKDFEIDKYGITDLIRNRRTCLSYLELDVLFEYFNKYHFDYRGLIPMGLANDCTNLNIY